jgi:hypothetical protein
MYGIVAATPTPHPVNIVLAFIQVEMQPHGGANFPQFTRPVKTDRLGITLALRTAREGKTLIYDPG